MKKVENVSEELFDWLLENEEADTATKIEKIRGILKNNNSSLTLLTRRLDNGYEGVDLHIGIDDYEDENNPEKVTFYVEVRTHLDEYFDNLREAYQYFQRKVEEIE